METAVSQAPGSSRPSEPIRVLVVDDSAVVREVLHNVLSRNEAWSVSVASDPIIAMSKMLKSRPHVIVLDLDMPRMDGMSFLRKLMAEDPVPVVVCSAIASGDADMALRALEEGAVDIVRKPHHLFKFQPQLRKKFDRTMIICGSNGDDASETEENSSILDRGQG